MEKNCVRGLGKLVSLLLRSSLQNSWDNCVGRKCAEQDKTRARQERIERSRKTRKTKQDETSKILEDKKDKTRYGRFTNTDASPSEKHEKSK